MDGVQVNVCETKDVPEKMFRVNLFRQMSDE